ncbi:hypothetical protein Z042_15570 [Chania multitudinisentens RB-25]|uniref:Uncharacterized protein n=1 Tax=Chania multitudinisentens RB-25 TaxID=1441930 RepID=W0LG57_9GAMM|nr:hypothetical protein [Chania multitudinisentens]AHG22853.1 hypothetical protein Z042_15570 [Chania multitudinisentens RB-25]
MVLFIEYPYPSDIATALSLQWQTQVMYISYPHINDIVVGSTREVYGTIQLYSGFPAKVSGPLARNTVNGY